MQGTIGMVNDHEFGCPCRDECAKLGKAGERREAGGGQAGRGKTCSHGEIRSRPTRTAAKKSAA